ncbi:MAG: hypothetical protein R2849_22735 [Thermomicrobiales bacterium]
MLDQDLGIALPQTEIVRARLDEPLQEVETMVDLVVDADRYPVALEQFLLGCLHREEIEVCRDILMREFDKGGN